MTDGVTPLAMAGAYQIFGNGGIYTEPYSYTRVETADGTVILEHTPISNRVISSESATVLNHLLQGVTTGTYGTGTTAKFSAMPVAGKTGTSDNDNNQWFIGVTPYYVGVWATIFPNRSAITPTPRRSSTRTSWARSIRTWQWSSSRMTRM